MNRLSKLKIALYLAAIFLAGAVTGAIVPITVGRHMMFNPPHQDQMATRWCGELQSELKLTPEQLQKIKPIVMDTLDEVRVNLTRELSGSISNCNARIASELTPEQKVKFERMVKEREQMIRRKLGEKSDGAPR
jgi:Spy/CpxP family protein refolding chaperone